MTKTLHRQTIYFLLILIFAITVKTSYSQENSDSAKTVTENITIEPFENDSLQAIADSLINFASKHVGIKYKYAGSSPATGFDCSGFVNFVFTNFGYKVPRMSRDFDNFGQEINLSECRKGDIITFQSRDISNPRTGHVGIIVSNTDGKIFFIHSATSNKIGVVISDLETKYYKDRFKSIRRIIM